MFITTTLYFFHNVCPSQNTNFIFLVINILQILSILRSHKILVTDKKLKYEFMKIHISFAVWEAGLMHLKEGKTEADLSQNFTFGKSPACPRMEMDLLWIHNYVMTGLIWFITNDHIKLTHSHTMTPFDAPGKQAFWKHCGKRRNCS